MEKKMKMLEELDPVKREWLMDLATHAQRLGDLIEPLKEHGIEVSVATLTRFVRKHREERLVAEGEEMKGTMEELLKRKSGESFRKATLEALRQRLYERALMVTSPTEAQSLYGQLLREEEKLKEMELEEEKLRLQRVKLRAQIGEGGRKRVRLAEGVLEVKAIEEATASRETKVVENNRVLLEVIGKLEGIINAGGDPGEKLMAARMYLGAEQKLLEEARREFGAGGERQLGVGERGV